MRPSAAYCYCILLVFVTLVSNAQTPLEAKIQSLQFGAGPLSPITILGVADGTGFAKYTLDYGAGAQPTSWTNFLTSSTPASGTLGTLDPNILPHDGTYTIRLTTINTSGSGVIDQAQFSLIFAVITDPKLSAFSTSATTFKPGVIISVIGTAVNPGFQNFRVEWASGVNPSSGWQSTGITLSGGGGSPVVNSQLATWDTSSITQAGYYTIRLTITGTNFNEQATTVVYLEPDLLSVNWPIFLDQGPYPDSGVVPALKADGTLQLVMASPNVDTGHGALWTLSLDGSSQKSVLPWGGSYHQPAVANLDGIAGDEVVVADSNVVRVFHEDMSYSTFTPSVMALFIYPPLSVEDLAGDSRWETIALGSDFNSNNAYLFAWTPDGQLLNNNFPIQLQDQNNVRGSVNVRRFLVGDFNGSGSKQIVVAEGLTPNTFTLRLFADDGTPLLWNVPVLTGIPAAMVAADLDFDGKLETILVSHSGHNGNQSTLHIFQSDGSERPGWPVDLPLPNAGFQSFLAIGDLNQDGHEEIVESERNQLYVYNKDGTPFSDPWPISEYGSVVIGDVDGDGLPEIVTTSQSGTELRLVAFRKDGSVAKSWELTGRNGLDATLDPQPMVGDLNQNGMTDIAVTYGLYNGPSLAGVVTILNTGAPLHAAANNWPMLFHDGRNTAVRRHFQPSSTGLTLSAGGNPSTYGQSVTFQATVSSNSGNPSGAVDFSEGITILARKVPLINGIASFSTSTLSAGSHNITAVYSGNSTFDTSNSGLAQTVNPAPLVVTANNNTRMYGVANPAFDGVISGVVNNDNITATYSTPATVLSPVGTYPIMPSPVGPALSNYSVTINSGTLTVTLGVATTSAQVMSGKPRFQHVAFIVSLTGGGAVPTGNVVLKEGANTLGGGPLSSGNFTLDASQFTLGQHVIMVNYSGDSNYGTTAVPLSFYRSPKPH